MVKLWFGIHGCVNGWVLRDKFVWFYKPKSEILNLKAREIVVGYDLSEDEQHSLVKQLNLLLSFEQERYEDVHLIDPNLTALEISAAEKLLQYVHTTQKTSNLVTLQKLVHYETQRTIFKCLIRQNQVLIC